MKEGNLDTYNVDEIFEDIVLCGEQASRQSTSIVWVRFLWGNYIGVRSRARKVEWKAARNWRGKGKSYLMVEFQFGKTNVLEMDGGDGCTSECI